MGKLLDDFAALHNFKQRYGLNPEKGNVAKAYVMERKLYRELKSVIELNGEAAVCKASGLTAFQLDEVLDCLIPALNDQQLQSYLNSLDGESDDLNFVTSTANCFKAIWKEFNG